MTSPFYHLVVGHFHAWKSVLLYVFLATIIWSRIARKIGGTTIMALIMLPGVFLHELLHFVIGFVLNAKPVSFSIIPNRFRLGSVTFINIRWYNAIPTALAPLLGLLFVSVAAIYNLPTMPINITATNLFILLALSPITYACWPSFVDWKLSLRGWPLYVGGMAYLVHVAV